MVGNLTHSLTHSLTHACMQVFSRQRELLQEGAARLNGHLPSLPRAADGSLGLQPLRLCARGGGGEGRGPVENGHRQLWFSPLLQV